MMVKEDQFLPTLVVNGEEINEYTYKLTDPRNVFTQPEEVTGIEIGALFANAEDDGPRARKRQTGSILGAPLNK